jgi:hypothetical protein
MCETYQGYKNRETWAMCLWLSNDHGLYNGALDEADSALDRAVAREDDRVTSKQGNARLIGTALEEWMQSMVDDAVDGETSTEFLLMLLDVGSLYRVDWDEVGAAFIPSEHGR